MTAHTRIGAAENAIATAWSRESGRNATHEAAVELESRGLLVDRARLERELRDRLAAEITAAIAAHKQELPGLYLYRGGMYDALRIVIGTDAPAAPGRLTCDGCGFDVPALYVDDPSGQRWCGTCKATVCDARPLPPQLLGPTPVPPQLADPTDPAGDAS